MGTCVHMMGTCAHAGDCDGDMCAHVGIVMGTCVHM